MTTCRSATLLVAVSLLLALPERGHAQQAGSNAPEEVQVVARRRTESLQAIPDSVTAFDATAIERARITNITDVTGQVPNMTAYGNFRPNLTNITIRGLISSQLGEPPIAFIADGVKVPNIEFINQGLIDVESIEVLRGSQGALYGANAIGGAVIVNTKRPTDELKGSVRGSYGNGDDWRAAATVSGPLGDIASFSVSAFWRDFDGLIKDSFSRRGADYVDEAGVQGLLSFELGERTTLDFRSRYSSGDYGLGWYANVEADTISDESIKSSQNVVPKDENDLFDISARLRHEEDFGTFEFVAGYSKSEDDNFLDGDFTALPPDPVNGFFPAAQSSFIEDEATTLETSFTSRDDQRLRWQMGAYYQDRERDNDFDFVDDSLGDVLRNEGSFAGEAVFDIVRDRQESNTYAAFGQTNYDLTDAIELTAAMRYDQVKKDGRDARLAASKISERYDQWQPKFSVAWQATEGLLGYATYAKGFRPGGFNEVAPGVTRTFESEVSDSYELGFKSTLVDGLVGLNAAYFYTEQQDAHFTRFNPNTFSLEELNLEQVDINGVELEAWWRPLDSLNVQLGFGITDAEIDKFDPTDVLLPPVDIEGNDMPRVADWNAFLTVTHTLPLGRDLELISWFSGNMLGERNYDLENEFSDSRATDLQLAFGVESERWSVWLRGTNLLDDLEPEDVQPGVTTAAIRFRNQPRQVTGEVNLRF
ncbi:MAG: TonB-dependent receptor [Gammaproteobacteria bacterium]